MHLSDMHICVLIIILAVGVAEGSHNPQWNSFFTTDDGMVYIGAFLEQKVSWQEADTICKLYYGHLVNYYQAILRLSSKSLILQTGHGRTNSSQSISFASTMFNSSLHSELESRGIDLLWVGIHREANYYQLQGDSRIFFKSKHGKFTDISQGFGKIWADGELFLHDCVVLNRTSGMLMTQDCGLSFPFVCENITALALNEDCPENWNLSIPLSITGRKCISNMIDATSYNEAVAFCKEKQSRLATRSEYEILYSRHLIPQNNEDKEFWAQKERNEPCRYQFLGANEALISPEHLSCSKTLPFFCVKSIEIENLNVTIEVGPSLNSVDPRQVFPWNSTCETNDLMICSVTNIPVNSSSNKDILYRWFKDDIPVDSFSYVSKISFLGDAFKWNINGNDHRTKQGSYHCEVRFRGSVRTYSSAKLNFFYSDIATYVIDIQGIEHKKCIDYSQPDFYNNMKNIAISINNITAQRNAVWDFKSIRRTSETCSMKLVLFKNRTNNYDDVKAYNNIKRKFEENASTFHLGKNISLAVYSADVCFQSDIKSSDTCGNKMDWPTTKQAKNVLTKIACLNGNNFVPRECKGSVNKAEWSTFDCSLCEDFRERYHDQAIQCPYGYEKFKNQDLCFRVYHVKKSWYDAHKTCAESSSYLIDVPDENDIGNVGSLWLSFKYSHGHIQGFGKKPINLKALHGKKEILLENIEKSHELHCVSAVREGSVYKFKFENCSMALSFVCVKRLYELVNSAKFANTWIETYKQNGEESCYYFENTPYSWPETTDFCEQTFFGAKLLNGMQDINSYRYLKKIIRDQQFNETECGAITWWMNFEDVIKNGMPPGLSYVDWGPSADFSLREPHGVITLFPDKQIYWSLEKAHKKLRVICEIKKCRDDRPTQAYIEDRSSIEASAIEDTLGWIQAYHLKCVPSGWFITNSISWYKDDILLGVVSDELSFHNITNITDQKALEFQGYYSCSVDRAESKETVYSSKHLLRIPGFLTFVLSMVSEEETTYLFECPKYILSNGSYENTALYQCLNKHFNESLSSFHFLLKNVICNSTHVNITVHVYIDLKENLEDLEEEKMLEKIQGTAFNKFCDACKIESKSIIARSTVSCYSDEVKLKNGILRWPTTEVGKSSFPEKICLTDEGTLIERKCIGDFNSGASWSAVTITECRYTDSHITKELHNLLISDNAIDHLPDLQDLISDPQLIQPSDIQLTVRILERVTNLVPFPSDRLYGVVKTVSNMIDVSQEVLSATANDSNRIIGYFETIASNVEEEYEPKNISTKNVHVNIYPLNSDKLEIPNCIYLSNSSTSSIFNASDKDLERNMKNFDAGIVLPYSLLQEKSNISDRIVYSFLQNINYQENVTVLSILVSVSLHDVPVYNLEKKEVTLLFKLNAKIDKNMQRHLKCVFWDDNLAVWSYKGCFLKKFSQDSVLCACNHLTSFTVIMLDSIPPAHESSLMYITYIGCILSCIGFGIIMLTFIYFREWRKSMKNKCLFNFSLSHFLFLIIYMAGIQKTGSGSWCKLTAIFLHYFLLSSFAWMIVLAYTVYLSLVKVFATYIPCMIQKAMAFAWGLPTIIVIAILSDNHKYYPGEKYCWLSHSVSIYGITIPLIFMLIINYIIFGTILYINTCGMKYIACNQDKRKLIITRAKALLCTSVLLGLSWIFEFLAVGTTDTYQIWFMYLFNITTTFQGFFLAIFFVFRPKSTRLMWRNLFTSRTISIKSHTSHLNSSATTNQEHRNEENRYENMIYGVVFKSQIPYSPHT